MIGLGTNLFQALGCMPPGVAIEPVSAFSRNSVLATCQPPSFEDEALRQLWVESALPAVATFSATARRVPARMSDALSANSEV